MNVLMDSPPCREGPGVPALIQRLPSAGSSTAFRGWLVKLSEGAPQHEAKAGQIVVLGELSPIAGAALLLLQRRVKRVRQRVGSQTLDQARRSRNKRLAFGGPFYLVLPENASEELWPITKVLCCRL